ncbi:MAG: hypothetical protein ACK559_15425, partial [bacterium]
PQGSEHPETPSSYPGDDDCSYQYVDQHPGHTHYEHHQDHDHRRRAYQPVKRDQPITHGIDNLVPRQLREAKTPLSPASTEVRQLGGLCQVCLHG